MAEEGAVVKPKKKKKAEDEGDGMPTTAGWMLTYGDMVTLLLVFFVLLVASASFTEEKLLMVFGALAKAFGVQPHYSTVVKPQFTFTPITKQKMGGDDKAKKAAKDLQEQLKEQMEKQEKQGRGQAQGQSQAKEIEVEAQGNEVHIRVPNQAFFDLGRARLRPDALPFLNGLVAVINQWPNRLRVDGHTDDLPINTPEFPSNWELSGARALAVLKYLLNVGDFDPRRLSWTGHGEYHPVERLPDEPTPDWRSRCRRIELTVRFEAEEEIPPDLIREGIQDLSNLLQTGTPVIGPGSIP
jgi:chemotaxis protein MotB